MSNRAEIFSSIQRILEQDFRVPAERIRDDATFRGTMGLDSLDVVDFIYFLEKEFGVKNDLARYRELQTLGELIAFIAGSIEANGETPGGDHTPSSTAVS